MVSDPNRAEAVKPGWGKLRIVEEKRVCAADDCSTVLSIYNHNEFCSRCEGKIKTQVR